LLEVFFVVLLDLEEDDVVFFEVQLLLEPQQEDLVEQVLPYNCVTAIFQKYSSFPHGQPAFCQQ